MLTNNNLSKLKKKPNTNCWLVVDNLSVANI